MSKSENIKSFNENPFPKDWETDLLDNLTKRGSGHTPDKEFDEYYNGGIKWISLADSYRLDKGLIYETEIEISELGIKKSSAVLHPAGTVLMSRDAGVGKSAVMGTDMAVSQHFIVWRCKENILDNWFLYYWLQFKKEYFERQAVGSTIKTIGLPLFKKLKITHPEYSEQKAIAHILGVMDTAINQNNQLITQKELRKKWLMQNLLTEKKRLKGFSGEWKEYKLAYFIEDYYEKPKEGNNYEVLTSAKTGLMKQTDYYGDNRITNREDADYNVIPPNYLTYRSRSDDGLFTFNKNTLGITGLISGYYPVFTIKNGDLDFILMYCNYYRQQLTKYSIGTSQLVLSMNALKTANFNFPEINEQTAIAQLLQTADKEIQLLKTKTEKLRLQKKGMMQVLLTGKKRLKINN